MKRVKIELEVGQVWSSEHTNRRILEIKIFNGSIYVIYSWASSSSCHGACEARIEEWDRINQELITNADGTPYVKPSDYQEGDVWVFCGISGHVTGDAYLIRYIDGVMRITSMSCDGVPIAESAFIRLPDEYKLIYRKGQGVIND